MEKSSGRSSVSKPGKDKWFPGDWGWLAIAFLVALILRLPWLWVVPRHIDELKEVEVAFKLFSGQLFPLHNAAHDIGALHNYILAFIFWIFGPGIYSPRLYVALTSALTVPLLYLLGKRLFGRLAGFIAAGLLLANGMHILVTHMAWANCTTPFFFTLAALATTFAVDKMDKRWLAGAGFLWGLTLQTHSSVIIFISAAALFCWRRARGFAARDWVRAGLAFGLGYANMILYNLISVGGSLRWLHTKSYTLEQQPGPGSFLGNVGDMTTELLRAVSSTYYHYPSFLGYLTHPAFVLSVVLLGVGAYHALRRKKDLPLWLMAAGFLVIPWINRRYDLFLATRYIMPVVLCSLLIMGLGAAELWDRLLRIAPSIRRLAIPALIGFLAIAALQWVPYSAYCQRFVNTDMSNSLSLNLVRTAQKIAGNQPSLFLIDGNLTIENDPLPTLMDLSRLDYRTFNPAPSFFRKNYRTLFTGKIRKLVAFMAGSSYRRYQTAMNRAKVNRFVTRMVLNSGSRSNLFREVYMVELTP